MQKQRAVRRANRLQRLLLFVVEREFAGWQYAAVRERIASPGDLFDLHKSGRLKFAERRRRRLHLVDDLAHPAAADTHNLVVEPFLARRQSIAGKPFARRDEKFAPLARAWPQDGRRHRRAQDALYR